MRYTIMYFFRGSGFKLPGALVSSRFQGGPRNPVSSPFFRNFRATRFQGGPRTPVSRGPRTERKSQVEWAIGFKRFQAGFKPVSSPMLLQRPSARPGRKDREYFFRPVSSPLFESRFQARFQAPFFRPVSSRFQAGREKA